MDDFKYSIGQRVRTDFNGHWQEVVIIDKRREQSETGRMYKVEPKMGGGGFIDENWLHPDSQESLF